MVVIVGMLLSMHKAKPQMLLGLLGLLGLSLHHQELIDFRLDPQSPSPEAWHRSGLVGQLSPPELV